MAFTSGMDALQQAIEDGRKKAEAAREGSSGKGLNYFNWKPGDKKVVRFIADDLITADFHDFILDKTGNTKNFMVDPADPQRLQRYMAPAPGGIGWRKNFKTGVLEEPKPKKMSVCVAVLRKEVPSPTGKGMAIEDYLYDKEVGGQTVTCRYFGIVQQSISNFWHTLATSCYTRYGTICDRDYEISREGTGFETNYSILPLPEDPVLADKEVVKSFYFYGQPWDPADPDRFLKCPMTTDEWAQYFSGEERYQHWLVPDGSAPVTPASPAGGLGEFHPGTTSNDEAQANAAPVSQPSGTSFASLQETLLKHAPEK